MYQRNQNQLRRPFYYPRRDRHIEWIPGRVREPYQIDANNVGRFQPNPAGSIGMLSYYAFFSEAYQPGRSVPRNYDFDSASPLIEAHRYGVAKEKYWGVTSDPYEKVYITSRAEQEVFAMDPEYGPTPIWKYGGIQSGLNRPTGICYDPYGSRLFVADKDNHRMVILSKDGQFISHFGGEGRENGMFNYPWDLDVSPDGNQIAITDSRNHRVQFFDRFGNFMDTYSTQFDYYQTDINYPRGVTYDLSGFYEKTVFVSDFNYQKIFRVDTNALTCNEVCVKDLKRPQGIAMDRNGHLVVCDSKEHCLRVINQYGDTYSVVKTIGRREFDTPTDMCFLGKGLIFTMQMDGKIGVF